MTDKEWKELWNFAEDKMLLIKVLSYPFKDYNKDCFAVGGFHIWKDESIRCGCCDEVIVENLTQKQIKAIITNLL